MQCSGGGGENHYAARRGPYDIFTFLRSERTNERERVRWSGKLAARRQALLPLTYRTGRPTYLHHTWGSYTYLEPIQYVVYVHRFRVVGQLRKTLLSSVSLIRSKRTLPHGVKRNSETPTPARTRTALGTQGDRFVWRLRPDGRTDGQ